MRDGGVEELHGDPKVGPTPSLDQRSNMEEESKDSAPERLGCQTIQEEVSQILQRVSAGVA